MVIFVLFIIIAFISITIQLLMINIPVKGIKKRKAIIFVNKLFYCIGLLLALLQLMIIEVWFVAFVYSNLYNFSYICTYNESLASYIALSISLSSAVPIMLLTIKMIKRKQYLDDKQGKGVFKDIDFNHQMQEMSYAFLNGLIYVLNKVPFLGFIHIINLGLIIWANISKSLGVESGITSTSIYMAIATFYSVDKTREYLKKMYPEFWKKNRQ